MRKRISLGLILAFGLSTSIAYGQAPDRNAAKASTRVTKVFAIADLVTPIPDFALTNKNVKETKTPPQLVEALRKLIQTSVSPESWSENGGNGTTVFHEVGLALVVTNTPKVVAEVSDLLTALRKLQDTSISIELREVSTTSLTYVELLKRADVKPIDGDTAAQLTDEQVKILLEAATSDRRVNIVQMPKVTMFNAQTGSLSHGEQMSFVTGFDSQKVREQTVMVPKNELTTLGYSVNLQPTLVDDNRATRLAIQYNWTGMEPTVPLFPITWFVTPKFEGGSEGVPIPFTQFLQQPKFEKLSLSKTLVINDGGTVAIPLGNRTRRTTTDQSPAVVAKVPYVNRLFRTTKTVSTPEDVILLVTVRIVKKDDDALSKNR